jgi:protein tyrosine/serine phosphatase
VVLTPAIVVGVPAAYVSYRDANHRNIRVVRPNVLYRSGQLSRAGLERLIHDYGIRTVVSLRDSADPSLPPPDRAEEDFCRSKDIRHVRITPKSWWPEYDGPPPAERGIETFLRVMDDPTNYPVLVHCFAGVHRTGAMVAVYRIEYERWTNTEALAELRAGGYANLDNELDVLGYLENYRPRWMK